MLRGGVENKQGAPHQGVSLRSVFQAQVLSCGFLHGYGTKVSISLDWQVPR